MCVGGVCTLEPDAPDPDGGPPAGVCGNLTLLQDSFDSGGPQPLFNSFAEPGATLSETGGQLNINFNANSDFYAGYTAAYLYDFHDAAFEVAVAEVGGVNTIIEVRNHLGNSAQLVHDSGEVYAGIFNVAGSGTLAQRAWNPAERFWRIREDDGEMVWELSTDRQTWSELHRRALPFPVDHVRGLVSGDGGIPTASRIRFDDVNVGAPNSVFCPVDQLRDDFATSPLRPPWDPYTNTGCTLTETGGNLVATWTSSTGNVFCGLNSLNLWDLSRGTGIVVDGTAFPRIANFVSYIQIDEVGSSTADRLETSLDGNSLEFRVVENDAIARNRVLTFDPVAHRWWRTRGETNMIVFETSPDRSTWTEQLRADVPFPLSPMELNIGFGHYANITPPVTITLGGINAD